MWFEIGVNVARKGGDPVWHTLVDDNDDDLRWPTEAEARAVLADEARGEHARLMRFWNGIGCPMP